MIFPKEFLNQIRDRVATSQVVGKRVSLKNKGKEFSGLCPFHSEKTPSFTVNDDKGFYHCFGCGAHGNIFDFVMQMEGLSFPEAIERLATEAGMEIPKPDSKVSAQYDRYAKLMACAEAAAKFFQDNLRSSLGFAAREYLNKRGLSQKTIEEFRLGFAPDMPGKLREALGAAGFSVKEMEEIGLIKNTYEMFRGRLIFPITDVKGRVIAFGGRILKEGEPKYLNSPETLIFHKRKVLYGRAIARKSAFDTGSIIVTEGYMDTISLHQAGFKNTVAPLGTSLTDEHLAELWTLAKEPVMCFDGDNAGKRAAIRAAELALPLLKAGLSLKFIELPGGQDPDDVVRANPKGFAGLVDSARPLSEIVYENEKVKAPFKTPEQQADLRKRLEIIAGKIGDKAVSHNYQDYFKNRLWQEFRVFNRELKVVTNSMAAVTMSLDADKIRLLKIECELIATILAYPELLNDSNIEEELAVLEFSHLEIDKMRSDILLRHGETVDNNGDSGDFSSLANSTDENIALYVNQGKDNALKFSGANEAWENALKCYHLEIAETDFKKLEEVDETSFARLQEKFLELSENRKKLNASFGE